MMTWNLVTILSQQKNIIDESLGTYQVFTSLLGQTRGLKVHLEQELRHQQQPLPSLFLCPTVFSSNPEN